MCGSRHQGPAAELICYESALMSVFILNTSLYKDQEKWLLLYKDVLNDPSDGWSRIMRMLQTNLTFLLKQVFLITSQGFQLSGALTIRKPV